jgi:tagatose 6-phosphate kinase
MVKPNIEELEDYLGHKIRRSPRSVAKYARVLSRRGIELVVVSCGAEGVVVYSRRDDKAWTANVHVKRPLAPTGSIGSGDSLVAGFAVGLAHKQVTTDLIRLGVACGAANVLRLGPGVCRKTDILELMPRVRIREIL